MALDYWNGNGDWNNNTSDWSTGVPPGSGDVADIQSGNNTVSTAASVASVTIESRATLDIGVNASLTTSAGLLNVGTLNTTSGSNVSIAGTLKNTGTANFGSTNLSSSLVVTTAGLSNSGTIVLQGNAASGTTDQATLAVTGTNFSVVNGTLRVLGDADLELATGITAVGYNGFFQIDGTEARVSLGAGTTSTAVSGLTQNNGTVNFDGNCALGAGGTTVTTTTDFTNNGTLWVDYYGGDGGTNVTFGGALNNYGTAIIGNTDLGGNGGPATTVTANSFSNSGTLILQGSAASGTTDQATLDITGTNPSTVTGTLRVLGNADLELTSGITAVGYGGFFQVDGTAARVSLGAGTTSNALSGLTQNNGTVNFDGNCSLGAGGTIITTTTSFTNNGTLWVDYYGGDGGTNVTFGGTFYNDATAIIGNSDLGGNGGSTTTVTATSLVNNGSLTLQGNIASGSTNQAILDITGAAAKTATGTLRVGGDARVEFASGAIKRIAAGAWLELDGAEASITSGKSGSALASLATNDGTFLLRGNSGLGAGGASVTTTTHLANAAALSVDVYGGDGGSSLTIGGALTNSGTLDIGNSGLSATTTVTAKTLANNGTINVQGNTASGTTDAAVLDITGPAAQTIEGFFRIGGDARAEFASGAIAQIAAGGWLELDGAGASITSGGGSALASLVTNNGTLLLRGGSNLGAGGASVTTTTRFTNNATLNVDSYGADGGSTLTVGGTGFINSGTTTIGNTSLSANTTVTAASLTNNGSLTLQGNNASKTTMQVLLDITGMAPFTATGFLRIGGDADLEFGSGGYTTVGNGAWLELDGSEAQITTAGGGVNSGLSGLTTNDGTILLRGDSGFGAGGISLATTKSFDNAGTFNVDVYGEDGGTNVTFGGLFVNTGTATLGNGGSSAATTITAAAGLNNSGTITLSGSGSNMTTLAVDGLTTNSGTLNINANSELNLGTRHFVQNSGTTSVAGTLVAGLIQVNSGLLDFTSALVAGDGTGTVDIGADGTAEYQAAVDSSHKVAFTASTGTLALTSPGSFGGTISGFTGADTIDLVDINATGVSYSGNTSGGTLTVTGASGTIATLAFAGNYTNTTFGLQSDGNGGTEIVDPPAGTDTFVTKVNLLNQYAGQFSTGGVNDMPLGNPGANAGTGLDLAVSHG